MLLNCTSSSFVNSFSHSTIDYLTNINGASTGVILGTGRIDDEFLPPLSLVFRAGSLLRSLCSWRQVLLLILVPSDSHTGQLISVWNLSFPVFSPLVFLLLIVQSWKTSRGRPRLSGVHLLHPSLHEGQIQDGLCLPSPRPC